MILKLVQIGNSRGIRLPKKIIEQYNLHEEVEVEIKKEGLLITKKKNPRAMWEKQIQKETKRAGYPKILIPDNIQNEFDESEWQW